MTRIWMAAGAVLVTAVLAGCSGSSSGSSSGGAAAGSAMSTPGRADTTPGQAGATGVPSPPSAGGSASQGSTAAGLILPSQAVIRTADLRVLVTGTSQASGADRIAQQADRAEQIAVTAGGSLDSEQRSSGSSASAWLTLKVPPAALTSVLSQLSALGRELSRRSGSQDVTAQVADVGSRVTSAQQSIERLRTLYTAATKVSDVIAVESELAQREADLESLEAQQRALTAQTSMATVTLTLTASAALPPAQQTRGFLGGLERGWHAFTAAAVAVATGIGAALPFAAVLAALAAAAVLVRRRLRPSSARPPAPSGDPA
jgi:hypothetical protein